MIPPIVGLVLNYRDASRTSGCLQSLLDDGAVAVVVWDNSADQGRSVGELSSQWSGDARVLIIESPVNLGFAAGVNQGLTEIARYWPGAWAMLLNNDALLIPGALAELHVALLRQRAAVLAYPLIAHGERCQGKTYYQQQLGLISPCRLPGSVLHASGCAMLIACERASSALFDETFFMYGEDVMLGYRLGEAGMVHVPKLLVRHEGSASSGVGSQFYESRMVAAHWLLAGKMADGRWALAVNLLGRMVMLGGRSLVRSLRFRSLMPFRALMDGWRLAQGNDPDLINARQAIFRLTVARETAAVPIARQPLR